MYAPSGRAPLQPWLRTISLVGFGVAAVLGLASGNYIGGSLMALAFLASLAMHYAEKPRRPRND